MSGHNDYEAYLGRLKKIKPPFDEARMHSRVNERIKRDSQKANLLIVSALITAILFIVVGYYAWIGPSSGTNGMIADYVFEREIYDGPVLSYVFTE
ncbi:MAG: hypothetical protein V1843_03650 [bacterium]